MVLQLAEDAVAYGDTVAIASSGGPWEDRPAASGAAFLRVPLTRRSGIVPPASMLALRRIVREFRPHLVHTHSVGVTMAARVATIGIRPRPTTVTTFHGVAPEHYAKAGRILRRTTPRVIACSAAVARPLAAAGYPEGRIRVIANGAALEPATGERIAAMRERHGLGGQPLVVGLGRLAPQKSWHTLIEAARHVNGADIVVAGVGRMDEELATAAAEAGSKVRFIGAVDDVPALLGAATCLVSTSRWEGLPLTLLEALSLGVPAITTAVDGVGDVVKPDAALVVPVGDADAVGAAINRVLGDPELAARLSRNGRELSWEWRPETMLARYRQAYREELDAGHARG